MNFPIRNGWMFHSYVGLPEGIHFHCDGSVSDDDEDEDAQDCEDEVSLKRLSAFWHCFLLKKITISRFFVV